MARAVRNTPRELAHALWKGWRTRPSTPTFLRELTLLPRLMARRDHGGLLRRLERLARAGIPLTVFVTGSFARGMGDWLTECRDQGHEIGAHSDRHLALPWIDPAEARRQILRCRDEVGRVVERPIAGFRAPFLLWTEPLYAAVAEAGFAYSSSIYGRQAERHGPLTELPVVFEDYPHLLAGAGPADVARLLAQLPEAAVLCLHPYAFFSPGYFEALLEALRTAPPLRPLSRRLADPSAPAWSITVDLA